MNQVLNNNQIEMKALASNMLGGAKDNNNYDIRKCSYAFIVMKVLNECGIERQAEIIKVIANVQKVLDEIMNDMNQIKQIMQQLQNLDWGTEADGKTPWDYTKHTDQQNMDQIRTRMKDNPIQAWIQQNAEKLRQLWNDLYISPNIITINVKEDGKIVQKTIPVTGGLVGALKGYLNDDLYKQIDSSHSLLNMIKGLDGKDENDKDVDSPFNNGDWIGKTDDGSNTFLSILNSTTPLTLQQLESLGIIATQVFCHSFYARAGGHPSLDNKTPPTPDPKVYTNSLDNDCDQKLELTKQSLNGMNTTESSDLSMFSQNVTSMIQEAQQIVQYYGQETKTYVGNFPGRG